MKIKLKWINRREKNNENNMWKQKKICLEG